MSTIQAAPVTLYPVRKVATLSTYTNTFQLLLDGSGILWGPSASDGSAIFFDGSDPVPVPKNWQQVTMLDLAGSNYVPQIPTANAIRYNDGIRYLRPSPFSSPRISYYISTAQIYWSGCSSLVDTDAGGNTVYSSLIAFQGGYNTFSKPNPTIPGTYVAEYYLPVAASGYDILAASDDGYVYGVRAATFSQGRYSQAWPTTDEAGNGTGYVQGHAADLLFNLAAPTGYPMRTVSGYSNYRTNRVPGLNCIVSGGYDVNRGDTIPILTWRDCYDWCRSTDAMTSSSSYNGSFIMSRYSGRYSYGFSRWVNGHGHQEPPFGSYPYPQISSPENSLFNTSPAFWAVDVGGYLNYFTPTKVAPIGAVSFSDPLYLGPLWIDPVAGNLNALVKPSAASNDWYVATAGIIFANAPVATNYSLGVSLTP